MSWGISENANEEEKLKAEVNDYLHGLNAVGKIDYKAYSELYDVCMPILEECYDRIEKNTESEGQGMYIACKKCKYNYDGECIFYDMGSGNEIDMPCY